MKKIFKVFAVIAIMFVVPFSFTGCGKDKKDYKVVSATDVWEESAMAMSSNAGVGGASTNLEQFTLNMKVDMLFFTENIEMDMEMGVNLSSEQLYVVSDVENSNLYFTNGKMYFADDFGQKCYKSLNFEEMLNEAMKDCQLIDADFSSCKSFEEFEEQLKNSLQTAQNEDLASFLPNITDIELSGKKYDDGRVGLVVETSVSMQGSEETYTCEIQMEYVSENGTLSEIVVDYKIKVDGIVTMAMTIDMEYEYGQFDSTKMPSQEWLDDNYTELA